MSSQRKPGARSSLSGSRGNRQPHLKVRLAGMRIHPDIAPMLAHNPVHRVESEARAFTHRLGRKEGIENAALHLGRNTGTVVDNVDQYESAVAGGANGDLT